jgi:hypothetical protein
MDLAMRHVLAIELLKMALETFPMDREQEQIKEAIAALQLADDSLHTRYVN